VISKDELHWTALRVFGAKAVKKVELTDYGDGFLYLLSDLGSHSAIRFDKLLLLANYLHIDPCDVSLRDDAPNIIEVKFNLEDKTPVEIPRVHSTCPTCARKLD
jgi:hypothetical protein